jgi:hypothetical protein
VHGTDYPVGPYRESADVALVDSDKHDLLVFDEDPYPSDDLPTRERLIAGVEHERGTASCPSRCPAKPVGWASIDRLGAPGPVDPLEWTPPRRG